MSNQDDAGRLIGEVLHDTYRISRIPGKGGMGTVYEAYQSATAQAELERH